jgi:general secretion pathway protein G
MCDRRVGPVPLQVRSARVVDAQAGGQRNGGGPSRQPAPETCLNITCATTPAGASACGFSMVELLIVLGIIMTLAALALPSYSRAKDAARYTKAVGDIHALEADILTYLGSNGALPDTLADIGRGDLLDPWGHPYVYTNYADATKTNQQRKDRFLHPLNSDYDLFSAGPDGKWKAPITAADSHDDIIRANDGAYVGLASQY